MKLSAFSLAAVVALAFCAISPAYAQSQPVPGAIAPDGRALSVTPTAPCIAPAGGVSGKCRVVSEDGGSPITPVYPASGVTPVAQPLTSVTCSAAFTPIAGRGFNVSAWGTFVATYQLSRSFDGGTTKLPITAAGTQLYVWTSPASEQAEETEFGVKYYICTTSYTSGTVNIRISQ